jgi:hypothetical protein
MPFPRRRERDDERPHRLLPYGKAARTGSQLELFATARTLRLASRAMPTPIREVLSLARGLRRFGVRQR